MNSEQLEKHLSQLDRRRKVMRRFVPLVLGASIAGGYAAIEKLSPENEAAAAQPEAVVQAHAVASGEIGRSDEGWTQGTAEKLIKVAVHDALSQIAIDGVTYDADDMEKILTKLPVYEQAGHALELAFHDSDVTPDPGDTLTVDVNVLVDSDKNVSYEVTDAEFQDVPNNQQ